MAGHYLNIDFYLRFYVILADGDLVFLLAVGCRAVFLHITLTIKADIVFTVIDYRKSSKFSSLCTLSDRIHTFTHTRRSVTLPPI